MKALPIVLGVLAIGTLVPAWVPMKSAAVVDPDRTGQTLNRTGKDVAASQVASLRVVTWDDSAGLPKVFEVTQTKGSWIIPSHYNYPADGGTRVGKTSGGVRNITRGRLVTRDSKLFEELGVVDPLLDDPKLKGRGKRVVLKDSTGGPLVDLIVGKSAPDSDDLVFVRDADDQAVYTAKVDSDISTRFVDWVETDLMKLKSEDVRAISVADYSVNEQSASLEERSLSKFARAAGATDWTSAQTPEGKRVLKDTVDKILNQATSLRLTGVRKFSLQWLTNAGFFPSDSPQLLGRPDALKVGIGGKTYALFGNEGRVDLTTKDGLRYSLLFGEVSTEDEDKPASEADQAKKKDADKEKKDAAAAGHNRYMSVYVQYDPAADEDALKAKAEEEAKKKAEAEKKAADPTKPDDKTAEKPAEKTPPGKERAGKAQARFGQFFYVISDENFKALRPALDKLFEAKPADPPKPADGAAAPGIGAPLLPGPGAPAPVTPAPAPAVPAPAAPAPAAAATPAAEPAPAPAPAAKPAP